MKESILSGVKRQYYFLKIMTMNLSSDNKVNFTDSESIMGLFAFVNILVTSCTEILGTQKDLPIFSFSL